MHLPHRKKKKSTSPMNCHIMQYKYNTKDFAKNNILITLAGPGTNKRENIWNILRHWFIFRPRGGILRHEYRWHPWHNHTYSLVVGGAQFTILVASTLLCSLYLSLLCIVVFILIISLENRSSLSWLLFPRKFYICAIFGSSLAKFIWLVVLSAFGLARPTW